MPQEGAHVWRTLRGARTLQKALTNKKASWPLQPFVSGTACHHSFRDGTQAKHRWRSDKRRCLLLPILYWVMFPLKKKWVSWGDLSVLLGGTTSPSCVYAALKDSCCHLGLLGGTSAALPASCKTVPVRNVAMNSCIPAPQVYTVCLGGGQEARQRSLTRKRRATVCSSRRQNQSCRRTVWMPVARIWTI